MQEGRTVIPASFLALHLSPESQGGGLKGQGKRVKELETAQCGPPTPPGRLHKPEAQRVPTRGPVTPPQALEVSGNQR